MSAGSLSVEPITDAKATGRLWRGFSKSVDHPQSWFPWTSLRRYEGWKAYLDRGVGSFWTSEGKRTAFLAAHRDEEAKGVLRVRKVPIFPWDRQYWGEGEFRGEMQDLLYPEQDGGEVALVQGAMQLLKGEGLTKTGASAWREDQCQVFAGLGFEPFARSILLGWDTTQKPSKSNDAVRVERVRRGEEAPVQDIFSANWGFRVTILPHMEFQHPHVALLGDEAVGTVLLNRHTANLDLGIQVVEDHRRRHVGTELVRSALDYYRRHGFSHMYVVRNLPPQGLRASDEVALQFYEDTGARLLREYTGFQSTL